MMYGIKVAYRNVLALEARARADKCIPITLADALYCFNVHLEYELINLMKQDTKMGEIARRSWNAVRSYLQRHPHITNVNQLKHMEELEGEFLANKSKGDNELLINFVTVPFDVHDGTGYLVNDEAYYVKDGKIYYKAIQK